MDNLWIIYGYGWWLSPIPLKNMSSSIGMMKVPVYGKIQNVPSHQPGTKLRLKLHLFMTSVVALIINQCFGHHSHDLMHGNASTHNNTI